MIQTEESLWHETKTLLGNEQIELGPYYTYQLRKTPRRFFITLAYYKFAAKMLGEGRSVLELGCSEGVGSTLLGEFATSYLGIDLDQNAVAWAKKNFISEKSDFKTENFIDQTYGSFSGLVSLDVIEHILPNNDDAYWQSVCNNLTDDGVAIIGTPNLPSQKYASKVTLSSHVNLYDYERMLSQGNKYFKNMFLFSANDETVHTGFFPMAHYLLAVCSCPKKIKDLSQKARDSEEN